MRGRFTLRPPATVLIKQFGLTSDLDTLGVMKPRFNIAPSQQILAVRELGLGQRTTANQLTKSATMTTISQPFPSSCGGL